MQNYEISAKKKFSILTKLMKNQKNSNIPPLIQNGEVINDSKKKSEQLNDLFVGKATVSGSEDEVPYLAPNDLITSSLSQINTSPIEVSKVLRQLKNLTLPIIVAFLVRLLPSLQHQFRLVCQWYLKTASK